MGRIVHKSVYNICKCKNCGREFYRFKKQIRRRTKKNNIVRGSNCITCSHNCSREYNYGRLSEEYAKLKKKNKIKKYKLNLIKNQKVFK